MTTLTVIGGLPGTGKSTVSLLVAELVGAPFVRVDRIEQAIVAWSALSHPVGPAGYAVAHAVAMEQLQLGLSVVVECVNPSALTRDAWMGTASAGGGNLLEVELICSDEREHQRRVTMRGTDVDGLVKPTWQEVARREYEPWRREHLVIDTATETPRLSAARIAAAMDSAGGG